MFGDFRRLLTRFDMIWHDLIWHIISYQFISIYVISCQFMSQYTMMGFDMLWHVLTCFDISQFLVVYIEFIKKMIFEMNKYSLSSYLLSDVRPQVISPYFSMALWFSALHCSPMNNLYFPCLSDITKQYLLL